MRKFSKFKKLPGCIRRTYVKIKIPKVLGKKINFYPPSRAFLLKKITINVKKINFFKYSRVIHQKKRQKSLMIKFCKILKNAEVMAKKL